MKDVELLQFRTVFLWTCPWRRFWYGLLRRSSHFFVLLVLDRRCYHSTFVEEIIWNFFWCLRNAVNDALPNQIVEVVLYFQKQISILWSRSSMSRFRC